MEFIFVLIIGYLIGSLPTAYLLMKYMHNVDIRNAGSGNVGAMNTYEVSESKILGFLVLAIDAIKGLLPVYLSLILFGDSFSHAALSLTAAVMSHCYNPWLRFSGGKGLATSAGGLIILMPTLLILWLFFWTVSYLIKKDIILANIRSSFFTIIIHIIFLKLFQRFLFLYPVTEAELIFFILILFVTILSKHYNGNRIQNDVQE